MKVRRPHTTMYQLNEAESGLIAIVGYFVPYGTNLVLRELGYRRHSKSGDGGWMSEGQTPRSEPNGGERRLGLIVVRESSTQANEMDVW